MQVQKVSMENVIDVVVGAMASTLEVEVHHVVLVTWRVF